MTTTTTAAAAVHQVTCSAPVNIAVVKYWGKRDTALLLPTNSSLSVTLSQDHLRSTTTVHCVTSNSSNTVTTNTTTTNTTTTNTTTNTTDRLWLNGSEVSIAASKRLTSVINEARRLRAARESLHPHLPQLSLLPLRIASVNNFPTAAGLASSASGFACLTYALSQLFDLVDQEDNNTNTTVTTTSTTTGSFSLSDLSQVARIGSGSACRSLFGGFVAWNMGSRNDGSDSLAVQIAPQQHWSDLEALVLVVSDARKDTGSTEGMQLTVQTSSLLQHRITEVVPRRMRQMQDAIARRDFNVFAELTMADSNQFHAVCLDTFPPIFYMNDISRAVIRLVTAYNNLYLSPPTTTTTTTGAGGVSGLVGGLNDNAAASCSSGYRAAYTYDAGPNAVLYLPRAHLVEVIGIINHFFPPPMAVAQAGAGSSLHSDYYGRAASFLPEVDSAKVSALAAQIGFLPYEAGSLQRIISTHVGDGPRLLSRGYDASVSLLNAEGIPI
ncbi:hypothetical protein BASA60_000708 [Batrachochytrium salamandrivorans]|nr:hypothetical protein BASA60_000708 [Batrachochytrium salamandrivorans]KAH9246345.1 diphosphomevalonate decarboxylase [Batrachochytrium salamandrivorans]KAH9264959.1 diphosphomevalonate decarboxylase [Batrachochytrium salamandrivorans]